MTRDYEPDLPKVMAYGSELNQVWTNLIDNAADAMKESGKLKIRAARDNDMVLVEICRQRPGNSAGDSVANFRAVFHHQGSRRRHRARTGHRPTASCRRCAA